MMIVRNAGNALQKALYQLLHGAINSSVDIDGETVETLVNVYDHVGDDAEFPAIHLEGYTGKVDMTSTTVIQDMSFDLGIWSKHSGKQEINDILDKLMAIISVADIDLSPWGFELTGRQIASYRSEPEAEWGYYGQLTIDFRVQNRYPR